MKPRKNSAAGAALFAAALLACAGGWADPLDGARAKVKEYRALARTAASPAAMLAPSAKAPDRALLLDALDLYREAGADKSADPALLGEYAGVLEETGYFDLAAETWDRMAGVDAGNAAAHHAAAGRNWVQSGDYGAQRAYDALQKALDGGVSGAKAADASYWLGHLRHREGLYDGARQAYAEALKAQPDLTRALIGLAVLDARDGKVAEASAALDKLGQAAQPHDIETRVLLKKALYDFESARGTFADEPALNAAYAKLLYRAGRLPDAALAARRATDQNPQDVDTLNFLGAILLQTGSTDQARQVYEKSLAAKPDQPQVEKMLSQLKAAPR